MATKKQQAEYRKSQAKSKLAWGIAFFFAIVWLVIALVPFLFMILNSFRKQFDMLSQGVFHLPDPWYFENYSNVVANGFFGYFFRSVIVVAISLVLMLMISAFAAYPLSRMKFRFRNLIYAGVVAMMAIPMHVTLIPIFKMTTNMGLYDLLQTPSNKTLPLALGQFKGEHSLDIPLILTVLVLSVLPMLILFIVFQDKLVKGMMAGAVKG